MTLYDLLCTRPLPFACLRSLRVRSLPQAPPPSSPGKTNTRLSIQFAVSLQHTVSFCPASALTTIVSPSRSAPALSSFRYTQHPLTHASHPHPSRSLPLFVISACCCCCAAESEYNRCIGRSWGTGGRLLGGPHHCSFDLATQLRNFNASRGRRELYSCDLFVVLSGLSARRTTIDTKVPRASARSLLVSLAPTSVDEPWLRLSNQSQNPRRPRCSWEHLGVKLCSTAFTHCALEVAIYFLIEMNILSERQRKMEHDEFAADRLVTRRSSYLRLSAV